MSEKNGQSCCTSSCSCGSAENRIVTKVSTVLTAKDILGTWKARWGINRMNYEIDPGLYCVGNPDDGSPVLVTANYKMSFDRLRKELAGLNAWIMVLDTKGINVWCAAGKGTFGTEEIINRIDAVNLSNVVSHRTLILPQLGAPGVAAHEVLKRSGFKVVYGPVRACDIPEFLEAGMKATTEMRTVKFTLADRLALTPIELVAAVKPILSVFGVLFIINIVGIASFSLYSILPYIGAVLVGCLLVPAFLPWIPGRAFAWKGWLLGIIWTAAICLIYGWPASSLISWKQALVYLLTLPPISAYLAMNFTGSSTYTSLSGVVREMKVAVPAMAISFGVGIVFLIVKSFVNF